MKTLEDYKEALKNQPSQHMQEKLLAEAEANGFNYWQMAELIGVRTELWA